MDTSVKPITGVRMADSGAITLVEEESVIKALAAVDDNNEVRLPERSYRIVMHCSNASRSVKTDKTYPKR